MGDGIGYTVEFLLQQAEGKGRADKGSTMAVVGQQRLIGDEHVEMDGSASDGDDDDDRIGLD